MFLQRIQKKIEYKDKQISKRKLTTNKRKKGMKRKVKFSFSYFETASKKVLLFLV